MSNINEWRFRTNWRGKLILQRKVKELEFLGPSVDFVWKWRDANTEDLGDFYARQNI